MVDTSAPQIEGYRIGEPFGKGGFSVVWAARRALDDAPLAIKIGLGGAPNLTARFVREAEMLQRIGPPHVPRLHGAGQLADGRPWIAMERLIGRTLAEELAGLPRPPELRWTLRHAEALLVALSAVHELGLVHRDLKPENIFLPEPKGETGAVMLLDFGLTRELEATTLEVTRAGMVVGTPLYMAPEQILGNSAVDARTDVYAFGVILFELLTSRLPFLGSASEVKRGHVSLRPPRPSHFAPVPAELDEIVLACLAKDPDRRPHDATALRRALAHAQTEEPTPEQRRGLAPPRAGSKSLGDARSPAVLVFAETRAPMPAVVAAIRSHRGLIARQHGGRYVAVFSAREVDHPALAALAAAQQIVGRLHGRAALHLSDATIRSGGRTAAVASGADVDHPSKWAPAEPWTGIVIAPEVGHLIEDAEPPSTRRAGPDEGGDKGDTLPPLFGREDLIDALERSAALALARGGPSLFTILGDSGLGKSRMAIEAADVAKRCRPSARIVELRPAAPSSGHVSLEVAELLRVALDAPAAAPANIEVFFRERLGDALGAEAWPAVAAALGWRDAPADPALHRGLARALAEGLRRGAQRAPIAVILDDAHRADDVLASAVEIATLDGEGIPLWVMATAHPRFESLRPAWGARTQRFDKATLAPLDDATAAELAAELLRPAEYPPAAALARLARWSGGNPACLVEIVRALKRAGVVRKRPQADSFYVATAELEELPASPAWQWLASRSLDALPPDLASCARLCAILGPSFARAELDWVLDAIEREDGAGTPLDAGFGLSMLVERGILRRLEADRYAFETRMIRDAIVATLDPAHRSAIHRHALTYWRAQIAAVAATPERLERLAMHAGASGAAGEAADAHLALGDIALARHRHVEAERHYTAALDRDDGALQQTRAHLGRGRCRYLLHRPREALDDLLIVRAAAEQLGHDALLTEALLEEATALDWAKDFAESAQRVDEARPLVAQLGDPRLEARLLVGQGRTCIRREQMVEAADLLTRAVAAATATDDYDTRVISLLLLPVALVFAGRLDEAEARFEEAIALAVGAEDWSHLCAIYVNRAFLWSAKKELHRALEDMSRTVALAREVGNPFLERLATLNVAEFFHWDGRGEEALALARRAMTLDERFLDRPAAESPLLMARILVAADEYEEAARLVDGITSWSRPSGLAPSKRAFLRLLQRVLTERGVPLAHAPTASWEDILSEARSKLRERELLELLYWRARMAILGERWAELGAALTEVRPILEVFPLWLPRFHALTVAGPKESAAD